MPLYTDPPPLYDFRDDKPTLLVCWWLTIFCTLLILLRVAGRFIRSERLFTEDKTVSLVLIPLFLRMGCVHVILLWGTNNALLANAHLTDEQIRHKSIASGLVLLSRISYAATLWILKATVVVFFKRLIRQHWERTYDVALLFMRCTLGATFVAIVISDLAECRPFSHYWQVLPDPGGPCRQGHVQLITMAVCNALTDLLLVFFPVPIVMGSILSLKRRVQLVLLFSLGLGVVGVTLYRVPYILRHNGSQGTRSLFASVEIFFATVSANALVLGSFVRDKGTKKHRFKYGSVIVGSRVRSITDHGPVPRRTTVIRHWGSDEDLACETGFGVPRALREEADPDHVEPRRRFTPAPMATMAHELHADMSKWRFPNAKSKETGSVRGDDETRRLRDDTTSSCTKSTTSPRRASFFDVGGLLDDPASRNGYRESVVPAVSPAAVPAGPGGLHRGSTTLLQDIGGLLTTSDAVPTSPGSGPRSRGGQSELWPMQDLPNNPPNEPSPSCT